MQFHRTLAATVILAALAPGQTIETPPDFSPERFAGQIPGRDLATDPPRVELSSFNLLPQPSRYGNAILKIQFHPSERLPAKLAILTDDGRAWLRNDGVFPDESPRDRIYSALVTLDTRQLIARRAKADRLQLTNGPYLTVSPFDGREKLRPQRFLLPGREELRPGGRDIPFGGFGFAAVNPQRSLFVAHQSVVEDPSRTYRPCPVPTGNANGKWTFKYLMQQMANTAVTGVTPEQFVRDWIDTFGVVQVVNGLNVGARPRFKQFILDPWIAASGGPASPLNLDLAPFELVAIVNRIDLRSNLAYGGGKASAGELRFVFGVLEPGTCNREGMSLIFEFGVPRKGCGPVKDWAQQWADLPILPSAAYNAALEAITEQVVVSNVTPGKPAGSALNQLRTNERYEGAAPVDDNWQMRQYRLSEAPGGVQLSIDTVALTPAINYLNADKLLMRDYINDNAFNFLLSRHAIPLTYPGMPAKPFRAGDAQAFVTFVWDTPGVTNANARHKFGLNTCNGCHTNEETGTAAFRHVRPGSPALLSGFLTGIVVNDPVSGTPREFNDLERRAADLEELLDTPCVLSAMKFAPPGSH